jgi:hypothetical protein
LALWSRKPGAFPALPSIKKAMKFADDYKKEERALAAFAGHWHVACERAKLVCQRKSFYIKTSAYYLFATLVLLLVPVVVSIIWPPAK